jgi:hypothetical protein
MKSSPIRIAAAGLLLSLLACRPVIAIGWGELFIIFLLVAFLLGPFLLKVGRALDAYQKSKNKK